MLPFNLRAKSLSDMLHFSGEEPVFPGERSRASGVWTGPQVHKNSSNRKYVGVAMPWLYSASKVAINRKNWYE